LHLLDATNPDLLDELPALLPEQRGGLFLTVGLLQTRSLPLGAPYLLGIGHPAPTALSQLCTSGRLEREGKAMPFAPDVRMGVWERSW